jgi:hypothetical protein
MLYKRVSLRFGENVYGKDYKNVTHDQNYESKV